MDQPLDDVRIIDLTQVQAGPSCTQLLAWLGADVIKIEEPGVGDRTRTEMAHRPDMDSFYFLVFNANKRSVSLNLKTEEGLEILKQLVAESDVVVENYGPGRMERFGLAYDALTKVNPRIIYASIKGFGNSGPDAGFKSFEHIAQATGGAMSTNGGSDGPPMFISAGVGDSGSGLHCAIGVLAALHRRDRTGLGEYLEVSMQDAVVNLTRIRMVETLASRKPVARTGNRLWGRPACVYPCHPHGPDDYVAITFAGDAWDSLLAIIGRGDLIGDERFATVEAREQRVEEVEAMIGEWTSGRTKQDAVETLREVGIPCGAVLDTCEVLEDPHLVAREMVVEVDDPERGSYPALGCPIKMSSNSVTVTPPPLLGQHTAEVLSGVLGLDEPELERLGQSGAI